jgi:hypothetical protein
MWMNKFIGILIAINQKSPKDITEEILFFGEKYTFIILEINETKMWIIYFQITMSVSS